MKIILCKLLSQARFLSAKNRKEHQNVVFHTQIRKETDDFNTEDCFITSSPEEERQDMQLCLQSLIEYFKSSSGQGIDHPMVFAKIY